MSKPSPKFVFCDLETTGFNERSDVILEVGFAITDIDLKIINEKSWLVLETAWESSLATAANAVQDMHENSGLTAELTELAGKTPNYNGITTVASDIFMWLFNNDVEPNTPLSGSTINFDRKFLNAKMPNVNEVFHYRSIDVSSLKELCRIWNPNVFNNYQKTLGAAKKDHRVLSDIHASIAELEYYCNEFLLIDYENIVRGQEVIHLP